MTIFNKKEIKTGDKVNNDTYGHGVVMSIGDISGGSVFVAFEGRKSVVWVPKSHLEKVE